MGAQQLAYGAAAGAAAAVATPPPPPPNANETQSHSGVRKRAPLPDQQDALKMEMTQGRFRKAR